jgi:hypothetical protein
LKKQKAITRFGVMAFKIAVPALIPYITPWTPLVAAAG